MMSDASLFEAGPVVDEGLAAEGLVSEAPVAEGLAADTEAPVPEGLSEAPVAIPAGSDGATFPALPLSNVLKCVKASTHLLQTKAAKGMLARSAAFFTVYLASAANDVCRSKKRSAMKAEDVVAALHDAGMGELGVAVRAALVGQRQAAAGKRKRQGEGTSAPARASPAHLASDADRAGDTLEVPPEPGLPGGDPLEEAEMAGLGTPPDEEDAPV